MCYEISTSVFYYFSQAEKEEQAAVQAERPVKDTTEFQSEPWGGGEVVTATQEVSDVRIIIILSFLYFSF